MSIKKEDRQSTCPWCLRQGLSIEVRPKSVGRFCLQKNCKYRAWFWKNELTQEEVRRYYALFPKRAKKVTLYTGAPCGKCQNPIRLRLSPMKPKKLLKAYYFTSYWFCDKCGTIYMDEQFKVLNPPRTSVDKSRRIAV